MATNMLMTADRLMRDGFYAACNCTAAASTSVEPSPSVMAFLPFCGLLLPHTTLHRLPSTSTPPCADKISAACSANVRVRKLMNAQSCDMSVRSTHVG